VIPMKNKNQKYLNLLRRKMILEHEMYLERYFASRSPGSGADTRMSSNYSQRVANTSTTASTNGWMNIPKSK
jgi:hypothetical protein